MVFPHAPGPKKNVLTSRNISGSKAEHFCVQFVIPRQNLCTVAVVGQPPIKKEEVLHDETADFSVDGTDCPVLVVRP